MKNTRSHEFNIMKERKKERKKYGKGTKRKEDADSQLSLRQAQKG